MAEIREKCVSNDDETHCKQKRQGKAVSKMLTDSGVSVDCDNDEKIEVVPENEVAPQNEDVPGNEEVPQKEVLPKNEVVPENKVVSGNEEVSECSTSQTETEGMPGCSTVQTGTEWQEQLAELNEYLHYFNQKLFGAPPKLDSLLVALWLAENYTCNRSGIKNTAEDSMHLKWKALDLMRQNLDSYRQFMRDKIYNEKVLRDQLHHLEATTGPVEYDVFMALTQVMEAVILVTEISRSGNVRTNSYYFGVNRPGKFLHICWISSLGYYDAVVEYGTRDSGIDICEKLEEKQLKGFPDLKPSHECDFRICRNARTWESPYTFCTTGMVVHAGPIGESERIISDECFLWMRTQEPLMTRWKFLLRHLKVGENEIEKISQEKCSPDEKVYKGLLFWRHNQHPASYRKLVCGLREDRLEKIAATIEERFMKDPVENDDCCSKDNVQLTSKEEPPQSDSEA